MFSVYGSLTFLCLFPFWSLAHEYAYARCACDLKTFEINRHSLSWWLLFTSWQWSIHSAFWSNSFCKNREAGKKNPTTPNQTTTKKGVVLWGVFWSFLKYLKFPYWKICRSLHHFFCIFSLSVTYPVLLRFAHHFLLCVFCSLPHVHPSRALFPSFVHPLLFPGGGYTAAVLPVPKG